MLARQIESLKSGDVIFDFVTQQTFFVESIDGTPEEGCVHLEGGGSIPTYPHLREARYLFWEESGNHKVEPMTVAEVNKKITELDKAAEAEKDEIARQYVARNAKFKIGDKITDKYCNAGPIMVETTGYHLSHYPSFNVDIFYVGQLLKKDGEPRKNVQKGCIFEFRAEKLEK